VNSAAPTYRRTDIASLLSGRPVKHTVGMTGEVTLQGRVLPIGGFKQKAPAAHAAGLTDTHIGVGWLASLRNRTWRSISAPALRPR
jgi:ATP-dependent Lon protease